MSQKEHEGIAEEVARRVLERLGTSGARTTELVSQELATALDELSSAQQYPYGVRESREQRIVVTANGRNSSGIVARLAGVIDEFRGDIRDISQTIVGDYFTMIFVVDIAGAASEGARFGHLKQRLSQVGADLGIHVVAMHDDILSAMHSV